DKAPLHIPFAVGLLTQTGEPMPILHGTTRTDAPLLELEHKTQSWTFTDVSERPVLSLLRNFSAPIKVQYPRSNQELSLLASHDPDPFSRWQAGQELASVQLLSLVSNFAQNQPAAVQPLLAQTWQRIAQDASLTAAYKARALALPSERELLEKTQPLDPLNTVKA